MINIIKYNKNVLSNNHANIIKKQLEKGKIIIIKKVIKKKKIIEIINYLSNLGKNNFSTFHAIKIGCPNHYRINFNDERSYIKGLFHQFNFFKWNQDHLDLFSIFENVFIFKNKINNLSDFKYFKPKSDKDCTIRLSFQFYPKGGGYLDAHSDPVDIHQKYLMIMQLSKKKKDFKKGGLYVKKEKKKICIDNLTELGDIVIFKASMPHGVDFIDPQLGRSNINKFKGRWMALFATNKLIYNNKIKNSKKEN